MEFCFQHEGLLIFPSLFTPAPDAMDRSLPQAVSLYYDFAGAIDNNLRFVGRLAGAG